MLSTSASGPEIVPGRILAGLLPGKHRSPTPILKSNDFLGQSDDIWGAQGSHFRPILGVPGAGPD